MPQQYSMALRGRRILLTEDCYLTAQGLVEALDREGAHVVGPVASLDLARQIALDHADLYAAVLDVNLRGEMIWPVADILAKRQVNIVFATGYPASLIKKRYAGSKIAVKPAPARLVIRMLSFQDIPSQGL